MEGVCVVHMPACQTELDGPSGISLKRVNSAGCREGRRNSNRLQDEFKRGRVGSAVSRSREPRSHTGLSFTPTQGADAIASLQKRDHANAVTLGSVNLLSDSACARLVHVNQSSDTAIVSPLHTYG